MGDVLEGMGDEARQCCNLTSPARGMPKPLLRSGFATPAGGVKCPMLIILLTIYGVSAIGWFFYWWQASSYLKEQKALSFLFWHYAFSSGMFLEEGHAHRKKSIFFLLVQIITLIILAVSSAK